MAGVKGRSGRASWDKTIALKSLWDLSIPVLKHGLTSKGVPNSKKFEIALALVTKMIPQEQKISGSMETKQTLVLVVPQERKLDYDNRINGATVSLTN